MSDTYIHLRSARKSASLTQEFIAKACGVSRNAVTQWESLNPATRTEPSIDNLKIISTLTNMPISALIGQEVREHIPSYPVEFHESTTIPIISWQQAESLTKTSDVNELKSIEKRTPRITGGRKVIALRVSDSSMTAPAGMVPSFPKGYVIHVDLEQVIVDHDCVIARITGQKNLIFKQLRVDGGKQYLHSLDPSLPNIFDQFEIIGKVVAASIGL